MKEGVLTHRETSETAASATDRKFPTSGVQTYRVQMQSANGLGAVVDVQASTGDDAALAALGKLPGGKVVHVEPSPQQRPVAAFEGEDAA